MPGIQYICSGNHADIEYWKIHLKYNKFNAKDFTLMKRQIKVEVSSNLSKW
jgi:hypothetical protein